MINPFYLGLYNIRMQWYNTNIVVSESADKRHSKCIYDGLFQLFCLQSKSADMLVVNCSTEETIRASGRFWFELIILHILL